MNRTIEMGRIKAASNDGRHFTIIKYTEYLDATLSQSEQSPERDTYKTTTGMHVDFKGDGKFEIQELGPLQVTTSI